MSFEDGFWRHLDPKIDTKYLPNPTEIVPQDGFFATLVSFMDFAHMFLIVQRFCKIFNLEKSVFCIGFFFFFTVEY